MNPTCFISYSWDSDSHRNWVRTLGERLQLSGVTTFLDQWDVRLGADLTRYMESSIRESEFVLLICTPCFATKANAGLGGVGYEKLIVTGEMFCRVSPDTKFVPVLRVGDQRTALPSYLLSKAFIDFRLDDEFEKNFELLLRHLHGAPELQRPPLGSKPSFVSFESDSPQSTAQADGRFELSALTPLYQFAYGSNGLNLGKEQALAWAEHKLKQITSFDLPRFKELYDFAYMNSGMNLNRHEALEWAEEKLVCVPPFDLQQFQTLYRYAYGSSGLNMSRNQAIAWVEQKIRTK